jgi:hypothetical protein
VKVYYRTDKRGNVRWHAALVGGNAGGGFPLCGVGPGEDDHVDETTEANVDCYRCRALLAKRAPVDLNSAMVVAPFEVAP